jgi:ABC-type oligopeptide transport system substrate-binding subunit
MNTKKNSCTIIICAMFVFLALALARASADTSSTDDEGPYLGGGSQDVEPEFVPTDGEPEIIQGDYSGLIAEDEGSIDL